MELTKQDLIKGPMHRAEEALSVAELALQSQFWNSAAVELYYSCFYLVKTFFMAYDFQAHTPTGTRSLFTQRFIKENLLNAQ